MLREVKSTVLIIGLIVLLSLSVFLYWEYKEYFTLEFLKSNKALLEAYYQQNTLVFLLAIFFLFLISSFCPVPIASILSVLSGALLGMEYGVLFVSFSTAVSATITFLTSRYLLSNAIHNRFRIQLDVLLEKIHPENFYHATSIRLLPFLPFFSANYVMSMTRISVTKYYLSTQVGMLLFISLLVNAGSQLEQVQSLDQLLSPSIIISVLLLIFLPIVLKSMYVFYTSRKAANIPNQTE